MLTTDEFRARWSDLHDAPDPDRADALILAATTWLGNQAARYIGAPKEVVRFEPGCHCSTLWLQEEVVDDPETSGQDAVLEVAEALYPGADFEVLVEGTDWVRRGRRLIRITPDVWWAGREYRLTYWIGYAFDSTPDHLADAAEAVGQIGEWLWNHQAAAADDGGITGERLGDYQYTLGGLTASEIQAALPFVWEVVRSLRPPAV